MALADPQSLTIGGTATSLPRVGQSLNEGKFRTADTKYELTISHSSNKRFRDVAKLSFADVVGNPLVPAQNLAVSASAHIVVDRPKNGLTAAQTVEIAQALATWATVANLTKLIGGES